MHWSIFNNKIPISLTRTHRGGQRQIFISGDVICRTCTWAHPHHQPIEIKIDSCRIHVLWKQGRMVVGDIPPKNYNSTLSSTMSVLLVNLCLDCINLQIRLVHVVEKENMAWPCNSRNKCHSISLVRGDTHLQISRELLSLDPPNWCHYKIITWLAASCSGWLKRSSDPCLDQWSKASGWFMSMAFNVKPHLASWTHHSSTQGDWCAHDTQRSPAVMIVRV